MVHEKQVKLNKSLAPMIRYCSSKQLTIADFDWPFQTTLDENNRWVKMSQCIPWDELAEGYYQSLSVREGRPTKDTRLVTGAVIIKHKLCLSDEETVQQIQENAYLQYFVGLAGFQMEAPFAALLLVEIRKRMGQAVFEIFHSTTIVVKQRGVSRKVRRLGIKQQLQYVRRNLGHSKRLLEHWPEGTKLPLPRWLLYRYLVIQHVYEQQWKMHQNKARRCDDRIVSISQPYVRPIVRGKQDKPVEFGSKLSVSLTGEGLARVDHLRWDAFHEGLDLKSQVESYRERYGYYPECVLGDPIYGTPENRDYLKRHGIRFAGKSLGRPKKVTEATRKELKQLKAQRREEYLQRIPIEGKFGQGKNGY